MGGCDVQWFEPYWDELAGRKHRKRGPRYIKQWDRSLIVAFTADGRESIYNPELTLDQIERLEMSTVQGDAGGELILQICHVRKFWRRLAEDIGASQGKKTNYVLVQYNNNGSVHGYPVTESYLRQRGAQL